MIVVEMIILVMSEYKWDGSTWIQKGADIDGASKSFYMYHSTQTVLLLL